MLGCFKSIVFVCLCLACNPSLAQLPVPIETDVDRYVALEDSAYRWRILSTKENAGLTTVVVEVVSQRWLSEDQVDRTEWTHHLILAIPKKIESEIGFLMISGGANGRKPPEDASFEVQQIARATGTVVSELKMVPNQALTFYNDGVARTEDDLIGYTWAKYLETGESNWLARNAMVKSAVRAMDTVTAVTAEVADGQVVSKFVVGGASKRGWTTWLTGAMDQRVVGIVPIVIDVLNTDPSMRHHFAAYGYWAPSVGNYVEHRIMEQFDHPRIAELYRLVDPYFYRHRLTMPKLVLNAAGDQFFLPDSSRFYWDELIGEKNLRYVPNTDHGMKGSDALESVIAFYTTIVKGVSRPKFDWEFDADGSIRVRSKDEPREVRLWQATNPYARDFRLETFGPKFTSQTISAEPDGSYIGRVAEPVNGWTAYFVEMEYDAEAFVPMKLTTAVRVTPDTLPYADRDPALPGSVTLRCRFEKAENAEAASKEAADFFKSTMNVQDLLQKQQATIAYFNWVPERFEKEAEQVHSWLKRYQCLGYSIQLESGRVITVTEGP